ncbi:MAG: outer membrane protein assembly factor BamE, partial [Thalassobaculaceae bacterium]
MWAAIAAVSVVTACAPQIDWHGSHPSVDQLAQIEPGKTGRTTVRALLGGASSTSNFDNRTWYYIGQRMKRFAFYP